MGEVCGGESRGWRQCVGESRGWEKCAMVVGQRVEAVRW